MKKTIFAMTVMMCVGGIALFANPSKKAQHKSRSAIECTAEKNVEKKAEKKGEKKNFRDGFDKSKTVAVSVKVKEKEGVQTIYLTLKDGKTYVADSIGKEGKKAAEVLAKRNGKKTVVSGFVNDATGVFNIIKLGGLNNSNVVDEK